MKITVEMPDWVEIVSLTVVGDPFPQLCLQTAAWAVKDGDTVQVADKYEEEKG